MAWLKWNSANGVERGAEDKTRGSSLAAPR